MSSVAQQFVGRTNDKGQIDMIMPEEAPDIPWDKIHMAVANMNSPNGRCDWTYLLDESAQIIRMKFSHTNNGESLPLRDTQVTYTLQVWGDLKEQPAPEDEPAEEPAE